MPASCFGLCNFAKIVDNFVITRFNLYQSTMSSLIVVGAGELGCRIAELWRGRFPDAKVYLKTRSRNVDRSERFARLGYDSLSNEDEDGGNKVKAPFVVFCAPPSENYPQIVLSALQDHWDKDFDGPRRFVFTSSGGVFAESSGATVGPESEVKHSEYYDRILGAEQNTLNNGGTVVRLGGLYTLTRGPHNFWLTSGKGPFSSSANCTLNMIHYDDAAEFVVSALTEDCGRDQVDGQLFVLADGHPITCTDICKAALENPLFAGCSMPELAGDTNNLGKKYDVSKAKETIKSWRPKHTSLAEFMKSSYKDQKRIALLENN